MNRNWQLLVSLSAVLVTSAQGALQFTNVSVGGFATLNGVATDNQSNFVAVGQSVQGLAAAFDLTAWTTRSVVTNAPADGNLSAVTFGAGQFVASGINASTFYSPDRTNWIRGGKANSLQATVSALAHNSSNGRFAAVALFPLANWATDLTAAWNAGTLTDPVSPFFGYRGLAAFGGNSFVACGDGGTIRLSSNGGLNWNEVGSNVGNNVSLRAVASDGNQQLVAVGDSGRVLYSSNGGTTWLTNNWIAANFGSTLNGVAFMNPGFIVVGDSGRVFTIVDVTTTNWTVNTPTGNNLLGVAFGTSGLMRGVTVIVGTGGTIIAGGTPPESPTPLVANAVKCAFDPPVTNSVSIVTDTLHPPGTLTIVWRDASGVVVNNNSANPAEFVLLTDVPGTYTNFARARDLRTGIESAGPGTAVVTVVNPLPAPPVDTTVAATNCSGFGNSPLTVSVVAGATADWFNAQGLLLETGVLTHIPTNTAPGTYTNFARARFLATGCYNTNQTPVVFTINPLPTPAVNTTLAATNCAGSANSPLSVSVVAGATADWFNAQGLLLESGVLVHVPTNTAPGTYTNFAQARFVATGCINTNRTPVVFVINPLPTVTALTGTQTNCFGITNQVTATLGGSAGPWNVIWSDGFTQTAVASPATRPVLPPVGVNLLSITNLQDAGTLCQATPANLAAFSVTLTVENCATNPLTIYRSGDTNVVVEWYGNLRLLRASDLTAPVTWSLITTGNPGAISRWTNSIIPPPPNNFFRLTNAP